MILIADPRIVAMPVIESGEAFADFHDCASVFVDDSRRFITSQSKHFAKARQSLVEKVIAAAKMLPQGVAFEVIEAYRPMDVQAADYTAYRDALRTARPDLDEGELDLESSRYHAPITVAPHPTGAAVDLALCWRGKNGKRGGDIDLGTPVNYVATDGSTASYTDSHNVRSDARAWRNIMASALSAQDLVNYPSEWWHWSYGDKYWAFIKGQKNAIYAAKDDADFLSINLKEVAC
jgi:zinc D-Ala-D-Ala dipeptidase